MSCVRWRISIPPGSTERNPSSPLRTCNEARRLEPLSLRIRVPAEKSKAARFWRPASLASGGRQCSRPAIIKCSTSHKSLSTPIAMRLPITPQFAHDSALNSRKRRLCGSKQKGACQSHRFERMPQRSAVRSAKVGGDIWQLRHPRSACILPPQLATSPLQFA